MTILPIVIKFIRVLLLAAPFPITILAFAGFKRISEKLGDWDAAKKWDQMRLRLLPAVLFVCMTLLILLDFVHILLSFAFYLVFVLLWIKLIRILKAEQDTLLQAKEARSSAESGAAIDYSGKNTMETEPAE